MTKATPGRRDRGFTMIELMMTLVVMGIALAASVPSFVGTFRSGRLRDGADKVASHIRLARTKAITENVQFLIIWSGTAKTFTVVKDLDRDETADTSEPKEGPYSLPDGVTMVNHPDDPFSKTCIALRPTGGASESGALRFANAEGKTIRLALVQSSAMVEVTYE